MVERVKPGTRCECRAYAPHTWHADRSPGGRCGNDAVRMVAVLPAIPGVPGRERDVEWPMCEPCATWHEKGGVPISAPGSSVEDLENDEAALGVLLELAEAFAAGNEGSNMLDPAAVVAWVQGRLAETRNSIEARSGGMPETHAVVPVSVLQDMLRAGCLRESHKVELGASLAAVGAEVPAYTLAEPGTRRCDCGHCAYCISYNDFAGMPDGTRCECRHSDPMKQHDHGDMVDGHYMQRDACYADAVRMVAVGRPRWSNERTPTGVGKFHNPPVPMCEACARHAEGAR